MFNFNSKELKYKKPFGAVRCHEQVDFFVAITEPDKEVNLLMARDGCPPEEIKGERCEGGFFFNWKSERSGLFFYHFEIIGGGISEMSETHQLTVYEQDAYGTPDWLTGGLMYQVFPDRFARSGEYEGPPQSKNHVMHEVWGEPPVQGPDENGVVWNNDFFGGNLRGVMEKLDYLESLGVTVIYFNPIFQAFSNHRYDTGDYMKIDPMLGTEADFTRLCEMAEVRGIRIIIDGVFNHTGSDSLYFNKLGSYDSVGAYQSQESPYSRWYHFSEFPDQYDSWWGIDTLPSLSEEEDSCLDFLVRGEDSVIRHWLRAGASGVRLDVADELPDRFLDELRIAVKAEKSDAAIIGEVWEDASSKIAYSQRRRYFQGKQLDSVMNYPLKNAIIRYVGGDRDALQFADTIESLWENYPAPVFGSLMNILGTHDTKRILTVFLESSDSYEEAQQRLFLALLIWAFMPGIPCIYYGDEIGMEGDRDPMNRQCFCPEKENKGIAIYYRRLLHFRKNIEGIGRMEFCPGDKHGNYYSFERKGENHRLLIAINAGDKPVVLEPELKEGESIEDVMISGGMDMKDRQTFIIAAESGVVFYLKRS